MDDLTEGPDQEQSYGTGEQIVERPDTPDQLEKENPKDHLPRKVGFVKPGKEEGKPDVVPTGQVLNLDTGEVARPETVEISGTKIDVSEFGTKGVDFLKEMYEQFLIAVQEEMEATYEKYGEGGANTALILEEALKIDHTLGKLIELSLVVEEGKPSRHVKKLRWTRDRTFEQWLGWTVATIRWRMNYELARRAELGILDWMDVVRSKEVLGECLVAVEKYLALSERERLIGI